MSIAPYWAMDQIIISNFENATELDNHYSKVSEYRSPFLTKSNADKARALALRRFLKQVVHTCSLRQLCETPSTILTSLI